MGSWCFSILTFKPAENQGRICWANEIIKASSDVDKYWVCSPELVRPSILSVPALIQAMPNPADGGISVEKLAAINLRDKGRKW